MIIDTVSAFGTNMSNFDVPDWFYRRCFYDPCGGYLLKSNYKNLIEFIEKYKFIKMDEKFNGLGELHAESWWNEETSTAVYYTSIINKETTNYLYLKYPLLKKNNDIVKDFYNLSFIEDERSIINLIIREGNSFKLKEFKLEDKKPNLELNYGSNFPSVSSKIENFINSEENGIAILNGKPGTGKTSYIRHLLSKTKNKVIYLPPDMVTCLSEPAFMTFLLDHKDAVLLIEDAEEAVISRADNVRKQSVANLLNISDGILGDCLKLKIICTFNVNIHQIDQALLRKGRLKLEYEFKSLSIKDSNNLLKHLGKDYITDREMTLAEIYNLEEDNLHKEKEKTRFGF